MDAAPPHISAREVDPLGRYMCPLCGAPTATTPERDAGWVHCPMLNDQIICLGCCLDYQYVARSPNFSEHPSREDFDRLSKMANKGLSELRRICMEHQVSVLEADLDHRDHPSLEREVRQLLFALKERLRSFDRLSDDQSLID
jgi:hypothetical protein